MPDLFSAAQFSSCSHSPRWRSFSGERSLFLVFRFLTRPTRRVNEQEFSPPMGRRALIFGGLGILIAGGGGAGILRTLYRLATFSYDGLQYKGRIVQAITP